MRVESPPLPPYEPPAAPVEIHASGAGLFSVAESPDVDQMMDTSGSAEVDPDNGLLRVPEWPARRFGRYFRGDSAPPGL